MERALITEEGVKSRSGDMHSSNTYFVWDITALNLLPFKSGHY